MRFFAVAVATATLVAFGSHAQAEMTEAEKIDFCQPSPYDQDAQQRLMICLLKAELEEQNALRAEQMRAEGRCFLQEGFDALDPADQIGIMDLRCPD